MGKKDDKFIIILDINKIFSESELSSLKTVSDKQEE
jgi:chemotaxis signal transduction protein